LLVVSQPGNDACRLDVTRKTTFEEVRAGIAAALSEGEVDRVKKLLVDGIVEASEEDACSWSKTVEDARVFGRRVTASVASSPLEPLAAEMQRLEVAVTKVEQALGSSAASASDAYDQLAQLEAQLDRLQCKGIDAITGGSDSTKRWRHELTRRGELLQARLSGLFVGLNVARAQK
jgi:hypothetical protein